MTLPNLPADAIADLKLARYHNRTVFYKPREPGRHATCANCGGDGVLHFQFAVGGPYQTPPGGKDVVIHEDKVGWWRVEDQLYVCPACYDGAAKLRYLWRQSGLEEHERDWRLDYYQGTGKDAALAAAYGLLANVPRPNGWLVYHGDYGRGKSGLLKCVVAACIRAGVSARYVRAADVLADIRETYGDQSVMEEADVLQQYGALQLLAVDEVDRISTTGWALSTLMVILDTRYNRRGTMATLLATNQNPERMPAGFEYLASRMLDGERVYVNGKELRG